MKGANVGDCTVFPEFKHDPCWSLTKKRRASSIKCSREVQWEEEAIGELFVGGGGELSEIIFSGFQGTD